MSELSEYDILQILESKGSCAIDGLLDVVGTLPTNILVRFHRRHHNEPAPR
jgi:hypothetical protein